MTPAEFRRHGREVVDLIADYLETLEDRPVRAQVEPGWVRAQLPPHPPEAPEDFADVLADVERVILPALTHWQHPRFFAYFPANSSPPSVLGELLSAGLGVQGMLWATSPAATELETHVLDWLRELLDLPVSFASDAGGGGVIADSASSAVLCALLAARERATGGAGNRAGVPGGTLTAYTSSQAHSSVEKAVRIAGLGSDHLRIVDVDARHRMRPDALDAALTVDREAGRTPVLVSATVGTTSSTAVDPLAEIGEVCRRHGVWLHVDAAYAGTAAVCPELRWIHEGVLLADSYACNPHKWLLTNFDCTAFYLADRQALTSALSILPEYLRNAATESGAVIDYRDWQVPLGRRFRALKLWFVLRTYGAEGLRAHIRRHIRLAADLARRIEDSADFDVVAPADLGLVCFRHRGGEDMNARLVETLNDEGFLHLTATRLDDVLTLRLALGGVRTEQRHVDEAWERIETTAAALAAGGAQR
jgi:aromatic-L-amino-acid/L-tryptophan decarboxylase